MNARPTTRRALRVAVVTETYPPEVNGVARTIGAMVTGMRGRGHHVQLIRPRQNKADTPAADAGLETILKQGFPIPRYQELRMGLPAKRALLGTWRTRRPDVVQIVTEGPLGSSALAAAKKLGIPVCTEFHTNFHSYSRHYGLGLFTNLVAGYLRRLHNRADCTMVPTDELKAQLAAAGYTRLAVVGRGIDVNLFNPARRSEELRRAWGASPADTVAIYVGRLAPEKNLRLFVEAVDAMRAVDPNMRVVLVGDGPAAGPLRSSRRDFVFAGMQRGTELAAHYASADVFLFPSVTETFGNVTTEAMASGLAVLAYDYAAARQYIRHGTSGLLAPFGEQPAFIELAQDLAADQGLRERLREGASQAAARLGWDAVLDDLEAVLFDLAARSRAQRVATGGGRVAEARTDHAPL